MLEEQKREPHRSIVVGFGRSATDGAIEARQQVRTSALRLNEKATEKQDAQYHKDGNDDNLDQSHGRSPLYPGPRTEKRVFKGGILEAPSFYCQ